MKPRTKLHKRVVGLSALLPNLTDDQKTWAYKNCLTHWAYRTKHKTTCMDCGHVWPSMNNSLLLSILGPTKFVCPACETELDIKDMRNKKNASQREFLGLITTADSFQVNRFFEVRSHHRAGEPVRLYIWEVVQQWLQPDGKNEVIAMNRGSMGGYSDHFHGDLEIREKGYLPNKFNLYPTRILPGLKCLPIYKRNGFKGKFHGISPYDLFNSIVVDIKAETLLKTKQYALLSAKLGSNNGYQIVRHWDSVKIAIRNNYTVKSPTTWLDYLDLLVYFKKDPRNSKFSCPKNLKEVHDQLVAKKKEIDDKRRYTEWLEDMVEDKSTLKNLSAAGLKAIYDRIMAERNAEKQRQQLEKQRIKAEQDNEGYVASKGVYFGIAFTDGPITIKVLESLEEFMAEAEAHKHCVFTNEYYKKSNSLIFSAQVDGKLVETIEVSISKMQVIQSRGLHNKASKYNKQIVDLMNKNMRLIKKRRRQLKTVSA